MSENAFALQAEWFNASEVDLGDKRQYLEGFWYGSQYMLRCFAKEGQDRGGVIPGLLGPWSLQDPVGWSDDVTLDCEPASQPGSCLCTGDHTANCITIAQI